MIVASRVSDEKMQRVNRFGIDQPGKLHIAIIVEDLRPPFDEGAKKACINIIHSLRRRGVKVSIYSRSFDPSLEDCYALPENRLLLGNRFRRSLQAHSPDFILYIPTSSGTMGAFLRAALVRVQSANARLALLNLQYRILPEAARYLGLHRFVDLVFAQSKPSIELLHSIGCKTVFLPGGVDSAVFRPVEDEEKHILRLRYGFRPTHKIILHVGHLNSNRNIHTLTRVVKAGYQVILIASTSTPIDHDIFSALKKAGVTVITDYVADIQHYYQMADCYLFPVFQPSSAIDAPLSVLEAMACNLPVVTTPFGVLPSMFHPGNGLHYVETEEEMSSAVNEALGEKGCKTAEMVAPYTWDCLASTILETFLGDIC